MRRLLLVIAAAVAAFVAVLVVNATRLPAPPTPGARATLPVDSGAVARFAGAIRYPTISQQDGTVDTVAWRGLHAYLAQAFPRVHAQLPRETVADFSLVYTWRGADTAAAPVVLMGHLDVVPVIPGTERGWTHDAFAGIVGDGYVWGRGTLDDKVTVLAVLEAVEQALAEGVVPARTVILAFGHDEEVGGERGARAIVEMLRGRGVPSPALVLDEGGAIFGGDALGVPGQVALVGIAEKGFLSLELRVEGLGGHSSTPPAVTHIGRLSAAIARLQDSPFPVALDGPTRAMLEAAAPLLPFTRQLALGNLWLTAPLVARALAAEPRSAAMVRTTTAPTIFQAGAKDNVLPPEARAVVNFRIRPGETVESVTQRVRDVISDTAVRVAPLGFHVDPSPVSDPDGAAFALVADVIRATLGDAPPLVAPYLVIGGTDARWWSMAGAKDVFRFNPFPFEDDAMQRFHGTDERIPVQAYLDGVRYYGLLLRRLDALR